MCAQKFARNKPKPEPSPEYEVLNLDRGSRLASCVQVAGTSSTRRTGLRGKECLAGGAGLWIAPCEAIHTFGMKIPIDAIFLDSTLRVTKVHPKMEPRRISVCLSASSVLELESGAICRSATEVGDRLSFHASAGSHEGA
ncbi:MAG: DUF192 domain-containing protein [Acidobacteriaceae bacterium]|nr:DUF192 domain-containing protein [Acidobacteriaceae bacterium]